MEYISTTGTHITDLRGAVLNCVAPDGSLYLPERLPQIPRALFNNIDEMNLREIAYVVVSTILGGDIDPALLKSIVDTTFNFPLPIKTLHSGLDVLELFDGPTLAFKDIGARFVAEFFKAFNEPSPIKRVAVVATTGNTGAAIANAFAALKDIPLVILFPRGSLSRSEQAMFTTIGTNIHALDVSGNINQCKHMVREALSDKSLEGVLQPVCVNTHNILRIIPQVVFYFYAYARLKKRYGKADGFTVAIPCGCLSSLTAAVMAKRMGLPLGRIVAGCNANDDFQRIINGEISLDKVNVSSRPTIAKAMDTGYPTNLERIVRLYGGCREAAAADITAMSLSDSQIADVITHELCSSRYMVDPHTATALGALRMAGIDGSADCPALVLATAHPAKSLDIMTSITGRAIELPLQLTRFMSKGAQPYKIPPTYPALRRYLTTL